MEGEAASIRMDMEFDQTLVEMKPYVIKLPHKADRQKCALWIKKFCEPPSTSHAKKIRNTYAQLLMQMLRKGVVEIPFHEKPSPGPLPPLPSYMKTIPDWVTGELGSEISGISSIPIEPSSTFDDLLPKSRNKLKHDRPSSPPRFSSRQFTDDLRVPPITGFSDGFGLNGRFDDLKGTNFTKPKTSLPPFGASAFEPDDDPKRAMLSSASLPSSQGTTLFKDDFSIFSRTGNTTTADVDMKAKMMEAKFQEEKLRLQHRHDSTVQKILDRKNNEIEELKSHYKAKSKEQESQVMKLERKLHEQQKEITALRESKEQQIEDLRRIADEAKASTQNELEKKLHDCLAGFEQEKFELHKQHTKSIQELLEETNGRLHKMESEYHQQTESTSAVIRELESRLQQLTSEAEVMNKVRNQLEEEKSELEEKVEKVEADSHELQLRLKSQEREMKQSRDESTQELKSVKNKHEATVEFLKKELHMNQAKAADTISELEQHVSQLKNALEHTEQQKTKQLRDIEELHHEDKKHLETLQSKKIKSLQQELEQMEEEHHRKIRKLESAIEDKERDLKQLNEAQLLQASRADRALSEFKSQVENNTTKIYEDMKQQMAKVEADLHRSKQLREKQAKEFERQITEMRHHHEKKINDMKNAHEQDKIQLVQQLHLQKEEVTSSHFKEWESLRLQLQGQLSDTECNAKDREEKDAKIIADLEQANHALREDLVQGNQLRKQQLLELGLLREEEKQKALRDHENQMTKMRSEMEQQRLELEKKCSLETEQMLDKTNIRLKEIESEYGARNTKANETIIELQKTIQHLKDEISRQRDETEQERTSLSKRSEEDKKKLKQLHSAAIQNLQEEIDSQNSKVRHLEKKISKLDLEYNEQLTQLRSQCEDRLRGLLPSTSRQELEDTISALKSQVSTLHKRAALLQDEYDASTQHSLHLHHPLAASANTINTLASTSSSLKSFS